MAATACAYGYQRTPRPPLTLAPARSSSQVPADPPFLDFDDAPPPASPPPPPPPPLPRPPPSSKAPPSFRSRHLGICTEGLGSESSGDIDLSDLSDDVSCNGNEAAGADVGQALPCKRQHRDDEEPGRARGGSRPAYPPSISVIGAGGKPWLYLRPHREDGRLLLREVRIPSRELLQARREDGRLKLPFAKAQPEEEEPDDVDEQHQCQPRR